MAKPETTFIPLFPYVPKNLARTMARVVAFLWGYTTLILVSASVVAGTMGVNWGVQSSHPLHPSIVVRLLKDNGMKKVKLFESDPWLVGYLSGTGIEVMLGIPNDQLKSLADDYDNAKDWVKENLTSHLHDGGVNVKYDNIVYHSVF